MPVERSFFLTRALELKVWDVFLQSLIKFYSIIGVNEKIMRMYHTLETLEVAWKYIFRNELDTYVQFLKNNSKILEGLLYFFTFWINVSICRVLIWQTFKTLISVRRGLAWAPFSSWKHNIINIITIWFKQHVSA